MYRKRVDWDSPEIRTRLGTVPDRTVAAEVGVSHQAVSLARNRRGISAYSPRIEWTEELEARLGTVPDRVLADELGVSNAAVMHHRHDLDITPRGIAPAKPVEHGTAYGYVHHGCRCEPCTTANRVRIYDWIARNPEKWEAARAARRDRILASAPHSPGRVTYYHAGCRCPACRDAASTYQRQWRIDHMKETANANR